VNNFTNSDNEINFNYIIKIILLNKKNIIKISLLSSILFFLLSFSQPVLYNSSISFFKVKETNNLMSSLPSIDQVFGGSDSISDRLEIDIKDIILSENLSRKIVLNEWPSIKNRNLISLWNLDENSFLESFLSNEYSDIKVEENAIEEFSYRIRVNENLKTGLVSVDISMENRELSVEILNYIKSFITDFTSFNINELSRKEIEYLNTRIDDVKIEIDQLQDDLILFLNKNKSYLQSPELTVMYEDLKQDLLLKESVMITLLQQTEIAKLNQIKISSVVEILDSPVVSSKKSSPSRLLWSAIGLIIGLISSSLLYMYKKPQFNVY
tara:strand:+ start:3913 stop:4887 length:975 start_codon:yes stop_codon:yes gene_type:complete